MMRVKNTSIYTAATLACGYLGIREKLLPTEPLSGSAQDKGYGLPRSLEDSLRHLADCAPLQDIIGKRFVSAYVAVKQKEYETYFRVISSWEREFLLLNV